MGDLAAVLPVSCVVLEGALVPIPAPVPPFLHLCLVAAAGLPLAGITLASARW